MSTTINQPPAAPDPTRARTVLAVRELTISASTERGPVTLTEDVSLTIREGQTLGLVGESGSGKSITGLSLIGLLPPRVRVRRGSVRYGGVDVLRANRKELRWIRGGEIGMVFQEPRRSLDPSFTVGDQVAEAIRSHSRVSRKVARARAVEMLDRVQIPKAAMRARQYPHQFSGGMCQRVILAIALASGPKVLIADEPTTALDVTVQAAILGLIDQLREEMNLGVLLITHDLGVVAEVCDEVAVMYAGQIVETSPVRGLFHSPRHPYSAALRDATPDPGDRGQRMRSIPGQVPPPTDWPEGCRFCPRCAHPTALCAQATPELRTLGEGLVRCHRAEEIELGGIRRGDF